ncbi:AAEL014894-PA, partial [Aedes aegypti]
GGLRDYEVYRFNNTVISSGETKVFKYFWKIERFTERLQSNLSVLSSPVFVISGLNLRIKATLNHGEKDNMYLQVEQLSPLDDELRKRPNVILQEGSLYDSVETKKFLRHKIVLLNQGVPFSDLNSQEFWNTNTGFTIPYRALLTNSYLKQDKILVEVVIYL